MNLTQNKIFRIAIISVIMLSVFFGINSISTKSTNPTPMISGLEDIEDIDDLEVEDIELIDFSLQKPNQYDIELENNLANLSSFINAKKDVKEDSFDNSGIYANGNITGSWSQLITYTDPVKKTSGFRVDDTAYDSINDVIYTIPYGRQLYKYDAKTEQKWTRLNNQINVNRIFDCINLPSGKARLIRSHNQSSSLGYMMYSDDEGLTWKMSNGVLFKNNWAFNSVVLNNNGQNVVLILVGTTIIGNEGFEEVAKCYVSYDDGVNYYPLDNLYPKEDFYFNKASGNEYGLNVKLVKPYNSNEAFVLSKSYENKVLKIERFNLEKNILEPFEESTLPIDGEMTQAFATQLGDKYIIYTTVNKNIIQSTDSGKTWGVRSKGTLEAIHPQKGSVVFKGFQDLNVSKDDGRTFSNYSHELGWDVQHMSFYQRKDKSWFGLVGLDFGMYMSDTPEEKGSYTSLNHLMPFAMHYDISTSEKYNTIYLANQDKGIGAYMDTSSCVKWQGVGGTDVLRVVYADDENSVWYRYYYGKIEHRETYPPGNDKKKSKSGYGNWMSPPMVASKKSGEDAIYLTGYSKLKKLFYDKSLDKVQEKELSYDFEANHGAKPSGMAISSHNTSKYFLTTKNGLFFTSDDSGVSWIKNENVKFPSVEGGYFKRWHTIKVSEKNHNIIYLAGAGTRVDISFDGGVSFKKYSEGLSSNVNKFMDFDLSPNEKYLFAVAEAKGLWVLDIENEKWYEMANFNLPKNLRLTDVQFLHKKNVLRIGTYGGGIYDFAINENLTDPDLDDKIENKNDRIKIYPNPFSSELNIDSENDDLGNLILYNLSSKVVKNIELHPFSNKIYLSDIPVGNYVTKILNKKGKVLCCRKISKK